jgi:uncharacterized phage protein gp47/JayE
VTAYARPSYTDLNSRIEADLAAMPAVLRGPLSAAWARACHSQHGYLEWIDAQCSPLTCELERLYDWAALYGVDRLEATFATGNALVTGTAGTQLLAGIQLRGPNGLDYSVLEAVTLGAGSTAIPVRCNTAGTAGNLIAGQALMLIDPVLGVTGTLTVDAQGLTGGAEDELTDDWRVRVADEWAVVGRRGGRSGKPDDYRFWAKAAHPSVTAALVSMHTLGIGTVIVRPICDSLANRMPTAAVLAAVEAKLADIAPATADWRVASPIIHPVTVSISLLPAVNSAANRAAIQAALNALVMSESSENAIVTIGEIDEAIATVTNQYTRLVPTTNLTVSANEVFVLNPVVWS